MKLKISLIFIVFISCSDIFSQQVSNVLFTIDNEPYYTSEFLKIYKKNSALLANSENKSIENYLDLYVAYKLKVREAKEFGFDTVEKFKKELKSYKEKLVLPYLKDEKVTKKLVKEAYNRLQTEVNASHILVFVKPNATPKDTLLAYQKIVAAKELISTGEEFSTVAKKYSEDPSVVQNGGEIGYFTALQMVYPFENVSYATKVNEVSEPFKTKFGYHILKVTNKRAAKGEIEVAHIMTNNTLPNAKQQIDSIYAVLLKDPAKFEMLAKDFSQDKSSSSKGGKLPKFGASKMVESFSDVAFSLENKGDLSKPFQTNYGWHIIKLLEKYPLQEFDEIENELLQKVENDSRSALIGKSVVDSLQQAYKVKVNLEAFNQFYVDDWKVTPEKFKQNLFNIENTQISQQEFISYLKLAPQTTIKSNFELFKQKEILNYFKVHIADTNEEFALIYKEFEEGMLLFEVLEKQVWEKSKDSLGLANFYDLHKVDTYNSKKFDDIRGIVISDYQNYLEKVWVEALYKKYEVLFNEKEKNSILNTKNIE
ncbi:peptidylprolyl isomerase [Lutibacter holmesii]|uniref:Peptidylprolyl isomerase n=1 Tax=Lutibacter holmesii TaxID=1137985 RepID=A0ABW3WPM2_9FLAO